MKKLVVVTGGNRGFGRSLVEEFSEFGWSVIALSRSPLEAGRSLDGRDVTFVQHDVRSAPRRELTQALQGRPIDLLINNAAQGAPSAELGAIDAAGVLNALDVNVAGPLRLAQFLLPNLLAAAEPIIVNVTSRLGSLSAQANGDFSQLSTSYAYKISNAAQNMLTVSLAQDLQGRVRCWALHPGILATSMGQRDASKNPRTAAKELRELVDAGDRSSPRFCSLGEDDLIW